MVTYLRPPHDATHAMHDTTHATWVGDFESARKMEETINNSTSQNKKMLKELQTSP
jgi:hypothetical protein